MNGANVEQEDVVDGCVRFGDFIFNNNNCKSWLRTYTQALKILGENPKDPWDESDVVDAVLRVTAPKSAKARLEWLVSRSAYVAYSKDHEVCWVMLRTDAESDFKCVNNFPCYTADEAIAEAMRIEATKP